MPTVTKTIGSAGGRDFSTLAAWGASLPANLVTDGNSYVGQCYNDSEFTGTTTLLTLSGHTTDATHTITLTTGAGQSFRDAAGVQSNALRYNQANGVGVKCTGHYITTITNLDANVTISNLQFLQSNQGVAFNVGGVPGCFYDDLIIQNNGDNHTCVVNSGTIRNSLIFQTAAPSAYGLRFGTNGGSAYFCTIVLASDVIPANKGILTQYGTVIAENTAVFGFTGAVNDTSFPGGTQTYTTCMTDEGSPQTGWTGGKTYANQFQSTTAAAGDFRAKTGADLLNVGTADSTNGATDIAGTTRPQGSGWDIGCWELVTAVANFDMNSRGICVSA